MVRNKLKTQALERDGHKCRHCGDKEDSGADLKIYFVVPRDEGGNESLDNTVTLCLDCIKKAAVNTQDNDLSQKRGNWQNKRKKVYRRDYYTCQNCHIQGGKDGDAELHAHHIVPRSKGGDNNIGNLITLCKHCHESVHDHM